MADFIKNSVIGLRLAEADLASSKQVKTPLEGCSTCEAGTKGSNVAAINIAHITVPVKLEMKTAKNFNPGSPWRMLWSIGCAYKTVPIIKGANITKGILGTYDPAKQQLQDWFLNATGEALGSAEADDILTQLFTQAQEKEEAIKASVERTLNSKRGGPQGYLLHSSTSFNELFREVAAFEDWDFGNAYTVREIEVTVNIAIKPKISDFCKDSIERGSVVQQVGKKCAYFDCEWEDKDGGFMLYVKDYVPPARGNESQLFFEGTWPADTSPWMTQGQWQGSSVYNNILQTVTLSQANPGAVYFCEGGIAANLNGYSKVAIVTDLYDQSNTRMSLNLGISIGGGFDSNYSPRPFFESLGLTFNLGTPGSVQGNVQAAGNMLSMIMNGVGERVIMGVGAAIDNVPSEVSNSVDGTTGNDTKTVGSGTTLPNRINDGVIYNNGTGNGRIVEPGGLPAARIRQR